ncbi:MAG: hypothetical protein Q8911_00240 [Bacillota bacterium]|nr:hypothetical protein [Bacillota bacterium]
MRIDIGPNHCLTSDSSQVIINEKSVNKKVDSENFGKEVLRPIGYVRTLRQAYYFLLHRKLRESDANGFKEVLAELLRIEKELKESIRI